VIRLRHHFRKALGLDAAKPRHSVVPDSCSCPRHEMNLLPVPGQPTRYRSRRHEVDPFMLRREIRGLRALRRQRSPGARWVFGTASHGQPSL